MSTAMNRLLGWHWLLIGLGASLILFLILYFAVIRPKTLETASVLTEASGIEELGGTPDKVRQKNGELKKAKEETARIKRAWAIGSAVYMPTIEFGKDPLSAYESIQSSGVYRFNGKVYGVKDLPSVWGRWISYWYASQARDGIVPITTFPIEAFSSDPNDVSTLKSISFPQTKPWEVEVVAKNFDAAMNHLRQFNGIKKHGMPVVDKVAITGQSPNLHMKYALQMFVIPPTPPPAPDPRIGSTGGGAGGGTSAPGGAGGGMMSMPMGSGGGGGMMGGGKAGAGGKTGGF